MKHTMPFGAELQEGGGVRFALWAPAVRKVVLEWRRGDGDWHDVAMHPDPDGWYESTVDEARAGDTYRFRLPDGLQVPDPASRANPQDVHGPSEVIDPLAFTWQHTQWKGRPWEEAVIYEMHVGTFTPEGTFAAAQARLEELAAVGITAIELMPVADFPGRRNWGYDGVLPFAPDAGYGTPAQLKGLVDAAHGAGLMVLLDVVYNHFGPEGNYLHAYCPQFFNPAHQTPWGAAINFDGEDSRTVRDFFIHNALYWIEEYGFDGLRMDAVHAIRDDSALHIVEEICTVLKNGPGLQRHIHVVLENDLNESRRLARETDGHPLVATAQWNDDLHHAAHVLLTGETDGYYADYADKPLERLGLALARGFVYAGEPSAFRNGEARGEPCDGLPLSAFVSFMQTHDQIGNRAFGERIDALADPAMLLAARACVLLSPHTPMLFMGEEFAASTPFEYFCDFGPELAAAVADGRRAEFARFAAFADPGVRACIADPNGESAFLASKLLWDERLQAPHGEVLRETIALLKTRRDEIVPRLGGGATVQQWRCEGDTLWITWRLVSRDTPTTAWLLHVVANFGASELSSARPLGREIHAIRGMQGDDSVVALHLPPGGVFATLQEAPDA
ncbi:malto-oligosyltrehalose trehalohydrolase [Variovorax sp. J22R133]|uniref:malto-oligosyltrehalose trehalohydrolase n=1 Tax=Variovorax brevis TaxID=3053503 RepID=UPI0025781DAF|nr:malto-oligosyltrehalose trehalohydrolase [Variovorax sp. J22R133]MDM0112501.1 malto-oligosyltrehalose trehalohydrolase [Variovorax sp. J22R133]